MAVTPKVRSNGFKTTGATSLSFSHTHDAGTNDVVTVETSTGAVAAVHVNTVAWDTAGANEGLSQLDLGAFDSNCGSQLWHLVAPTPGASKTVLVTPVGTCEITAGAASYWYVNQGAPWRNGAFVRATGSSGQPSVSCPSAAGDVVVFGAFSNENAGNDTLVPAGGATQIYEQEVGSGKHTGAAADIPGATSVTASMTGVGGGNQWGIVAGSLQWDGTGGGVAVVVGPAPYRQPVPMRPGPGGFTRGTPFRGDTSHPVSSTPTATGDSNVALPLSGNATATVLVQGASAITLPLAGAAAATVLVQAASSGALPLSGSASGAVLVQAASSVSLPLSGAAAGTVLVQAASAVTLALSGSATGTVANPLSTPAPYQMGIPMRPGPGGLIIGRPFQGDTSNPVPLNPTATGVSSLTLPLSGSATATVLVQAASSVSLPLGGAAAGTVLVQANSSVTLPLSGAATGAVLDQAASSVLLPLNGAAAGTVLVQAVSNGAVPLTGSATGNIGVVSIADSNRALPLAGNATAAVLVQAISALALRLTGSATGHVGSGIVTLGPRPLTVARRNGAAGTGNIVLRRNPST